MDLSWAAADPLPILRVEGSADAVAAMRIYHRWVVDGASLEWAEDLVREVSDAGETVVLFERPLPVTPPTDTASAVSLTTSTGQVRTRVIAFDAVGAELYRSTAPLLDASFHMSGGDVVLTRADVQSVTFAPDGSLRPTDPALTIEVVDAP